MRQSSKCTWHVGEPVIPSLDSFLPTENPGSSLVTMNAETPFAPAAGSVLASTL